MRFTCAQLAELQLPGYPTSRQGWDKLVKDKDWPFEEFHGAGRGGVRREYHPPPGVLALIEARQRGEFPTAPVRQLLRHPALNEKSAAYMSRAAAGDESSIGMVIDKNMLAACHAACKRVYGDAFGALSAIDQMDYAADLYNLSVKMSAQNGGLEQMKRLESDGMVKLLDVFISLGWTREFPPPPPTNQFSF